MLRIIAGVHRGRKLETAPGNTLRPTAERVREAIFNKLTHGLVTTSGAPLTDVHVLDVFAGTGALGFEALSRGALRVAFFENDAATARLIKRNAEYLGAANTVAFSTGASTSGTACFNSSIALEQYFGRTNDSDSMSSLFSELLPSAIPMANVPNAEQTSANVRPTPVRFAETYNIAAPKDEYCFIRCNSLHIDEDDFLDDDEVDERMFSNSTLSLVEKIDRESLSLQLLFPKCFPPFFPIDIPLIFKSPLAVANLTNQEIASRNVPLAIP